MKLRQTIQSVLLRSNVIIQQDEINNTETDEQLPLNNTQILPNGCFDAYEVKVNKDIFKYQEKGKSNLSIPEIF